MIGYRPLSWKDQPYSTSSHRKNRNVVYQVAIGLNKLSKKVPIFRDETNCKWIIKMGTMKRTYPYVIVNLSPINYLKRMEGDEIKRLDIL